MMSTPPQIPSYTQGFARQRGDSAHPEPWEGLVGLWAPVLGPTGMTLLNWSPYGQALDGTLTNMDPGADWVGSESGWTLDFSDNTDRVTVPHAAALIPPRVSVRVVLKTPASLIDWSFVLDKRSEDDYVDYYLLYRSNGDLQAGFREIGGGWVEHKVSSAIAASSWYDVVFSFGGGRAKIWIDGRLRLDEPETGSMPGTSAELCLGNGYQGTSSFRGKLLLSAIWDRVLTSSRVGQLHGDRLAPLRLRCGALRVLPGVGGPYRAAVGEVFHAGSEEGEVFSAGTIIGECDGRSG